MALTGAVLVVALLVGCGGQGRDAAGDTAPAMSDYDVGDTFRSPEPLTVSMLWTDWPSAPVDPDWEVFEEIRRLTNVTIEPVAVPFRDAVAKRSLLISAGNAPDVIPATYPGQEVAFGVSGAVLPVSEYEDLMPHLTSLTEQWDLQDEVDRLRLSDGEYYLLPGLQEVSAPAFTLVVRQDVLDEAGLPTPDSWEEVREVLRVLKERHPDSVPLADGFEGGAMLNYAAHAFGTIAGWGFGDGLVEDPATGRLAYAAATHEYRELVTFLRSLVDEGLLDPASFTERNDGGGTALDDVVAGRTFAVSGTAATVQELRLQAQRERPGEPFALTLLPPPAGPAGAVVEPRGLWAGAMVSARLADDPRLVPVMQFLDWLLYSPQARELLRWGVEGRTWERGDDDGHQLLPGYSLDALNLGAGEPVDLQRDLGYASNVLATGTESRALMESLAPDLLPDYLDRVLATRTQRDPLPRVVLTAQEAEEAALLATPLRDTVMTATLQTVVGTRDPQAWDEVVAELERQGMARYLALMEGARERAAADLG